MWKISLNISLQNMQVFLKDTSLPKNNPENLRWAKITPNATLVTSDITGAYQNIPQNDGSKCLNDAVPSTNIFELHDRMLWRQLIGVAMGMHPAPSFANIYLARRLDNQIK